MSISASSGRSRSFPSGIAPACNHSRSILRHGWIGVDPTNNQIPHDKHIILAWGRDYDDVSPIKGVILGGGRHSLAVAVDVLATDAIEGDGAALM